MKLYTEFEVRNMLDNMGTLTEEGIDYHISEMKPIELPSDDEIEEKIEESTCSLEYDTDFKWGAKWIIEQIKQKADG